MLAQYKLTISIFLCTLVFFLSCKEQKPSQGKRKKVSEKIFDDPIQDSLKDFWYTHQVASPDRLKIVNDPDNSNNDLLKVSLQVGDKVAGGSRSEIFIKPKDSFGYRNNYSFRFKFPKSFFENEEKEGVILLNQWHNVPYPGYNYTNQIVKVRVPFAMMVKHTTDGEFYMLLHYGLKVGILNEMVFAKWPGNLKPDVWYTFENEIFWSLYDDGYAIPKIDGTCFQVEDKDVCTLKGANMYHVRPHDYKMGLYWSAGHMHDRYIYYDEFYMNTQRTSYFPSN